MIRYILVLSVLFITGCAAIYDGADKCQTWNKPQGYQQPNFCGSSSSKTVYTSRDNSGRVIATTRAQQ